MISLGVVVPLYNKLIIDTPIYQSVSKFGSDYVKIYICDNSTDMSIKVINKSFCGDDKYAIYLDMHSNAGYSKACNYAINIMREDAICIFDDDTRPCPDFFQRVLFHLENTPKEAKVFIPIVETSGVLLSPLRVFGPAIFRIKSPAKLNLEKCSAINSGLVFRREVFSQVRFDENLFLDFVDHALFRELHSKRIKLTLMPDVILDQNYSANSNSLNAALFRAKIQYKDIREFYSVSPLYSFYGAAYIGYLIIKRCIMYRSFAFLMIY